MHSWAFPAAHGGVAEPRVGRHVRHAEAVHEVVPVLVALQQDQADEAVVGGAVGADAGVGRLGAVALGDLREPEQLRRDDHRRDLPHRGGQQGDVDDAGLAGALPLDQGRGDGAGRGQTAHDVAEGRCRLAGRPAAFALGHAGPHASAGPERGAVVAPLLRVRALGTGARAAGDDDVRVSGADVVGVDPQLSTDRRQVVGEEDVGCLDELHERLAPVVMGEVERDGALAPVGLLDHEVHAPGPTGQEAGRHQTPLRVASGDRLHLDDIGTPVDEHRAAGWDEHPAGDLDDADAVERSRHCVLLRGLGHHTSSRLSTERSPCE